MTREELSEKRTAIDTMVKYGRINEALATMKECFEALSAEPCEDAVLKALEDVKAKAHASILMFRNEHYENKEVATGCDKLIESINDYIDDKIKEIENDR